MTYQKCLLSEYHTNPSEGRGISVGKGFSVGWGVFVRRPQTLLNIKGKSVIDLVKGQRLLLLFIDLLFVATA